MKDNDSKQRLRRKMGEVGRWAKWENKQYGKICIVGRRGRLGRWAK
jgi:hypothetical protein